MIVINKEPKEVMIHGTEHMNKKYHGTDEFVTVKNKVFEVYAETHEGKPISLYFKTKELAMDFFKKHRNI